MKTTKGVFVFLFFFSISALAQRPAVDFLNTFTAINHPGVVNGIWAVDIEVSDLGDVYYSYVYPQNGVEALIQGVSHFTNSSSNTDVSSIVYKFSPNGALLWSHNFETPSTSSNLNRISIQGLSLDDTSNLFVAGYFSDGVDLIPDGQNVNTLNAGIYNNNLFVAKYDPSGNYKSSFRINSSNYLDATSFEIDSLGGMYLSVRFKGNLILKDSVNNDIILNQSNWGTVFLKYDASGKLLWHNFFEASSNAFLTFYTKVSAGLELYAFGNFNGDIMDSTGSVIQSSSGNSEDLILLKLKSDGSLDFSKSYPSPNYEIGRDILLDEQSNSLYLIGEFRDYLDILQNGSFYSSKGYTDGFIAKANLNGDLKWLNTIGTNLYDRLYSMTKGHNTNEIIAVGRASASTSINYNYSPGQPRYADRVASNGTEQIIMLNIDTTGYIRDVRTFGGSGDQETGRVIKTTIQNKYVLAGWYDANFELDEFNNTGLVYPPLTSSQFSSGFLTSFELIDPVWDSLKITGCPVVHYDGRNYNYGIDLIDTIYRNGYNDSLTFVSLRIPDPKADVIYTNGDFVAIDTMNLNYQWYDCLNERVIPNENDSIFRPTKVGIYALIVEQYGCTDTSECIVVLDIGIQENQLDKLSVYPNPGTDLIKISKPISLDVLSVELTNLAGQVLISQQNADEIDITVFTPAVYLMKINTSEGLVVKRFIKM